MNMYYEKNLKGSRRVIGMEKMASYLRWSEKASEIGGFGSK